jgi:hypothetical protein
LRGHPEWLRIIGRQPEAVPGIGWMLAVLAKWFPPIDNRAKAAELSRQGALGVSLVTASYMLGAAFSYFFDLDMGTGEAFKSASDKGAALVGIIVTIPVLAVAAWRVYQGKGWLAAGLVGVLFLGDVIIKISTGTTNAGWMIAYVAVFGMLINGVRACWWLRAERQRSKQS